MKAKHHCSQQNNAFDDERQTFRQSPLTEMHLAHDIYDQTIRDSKSDAMRGMVANRAIFMEDQFELNGPIFKGAGSR